MKAGFRPSAPPCLCPFQLCAPSGPVTPLCPIRVLQGEGCSHGAPMPVVPCGGLWPCPTGRLLEVSSLLCARVGVGQPSVAPAPPQVWPPGRAGARMRAAMTKWMWRKPAHFGSPSWPSSSSLWSTAASSPSSRQVAWAGGALCPETEPLGLARVSEGAALSPGVGQVLGPAPQGHGEVGSPARLTRGPGPQSPSPFLTPGLLLQVK